MLQRLFPEIPYDIQREVIHTSWHSPSLSTQDRITFMISSTTISKSWMNIFNRVAYRDIYIPCPSYLKYYLHMLRLDTSAHNDTPRHLSNDLCRSLTFAFDSPNMTRFCLSELLHSIKIFGTLPHLRTLTIRYSSFSLDDIFDCYQYIDFPDQIENLEVSVTSKTRVGGIQPLRVIVDPPWHLPHVRRLSIKGGDENLVANYLDACPQLQVLETDLKFQIKGLQV
ncbi:hypothetical protein M413DRAFT_366543 [Hebeloma cylindrosporum]|uniref:F-box domain-containing protein n=1 Tax=Hebeloma cylindrosporum TaxID=76867 RepID=A0A0C2Y4X7_HEBCY|nr:hypothetical protein M413DRAFT_366543 [Hebeloma cylindrosporum h7]